MAKQSTTCSQCGCMEWEKLKQGKKCVYCGYVELAKDQGGVSFPVGETTNDVTYVQKQQLQMAYNTVQGKAVNKWIYILLALFLGWIGVHKLYARKNWLLYLLFFWTGVPEILSWIDIVRALFKPTDKNGEIAI